MTAILIAGYRFQDFAGKMRRLLYRPPQVLLLASIIPFDDFNDAIMSFILCVCVCVCMLECRRACNACLID